ncbi:hypothetical protein [Pseudonocardia sp. ICBG1293]|uniref:hypothetical protein n=1 Tax=Pseudonocardia sp. ICBG1293 TaxID=2844382 RepID=UPI001CCFA28F|nr:hypothetical protein [Pseudonocardia sp. ICBG1293]
MLRYELGWKGYDYARIKADLNELGREGWEAVGSLTPSIGTGPQDIVVLLKRAVP